MLELQFHVVVVFGVWSTITVWQAEDNSILAPPLPPPPYVNNHNMQPVISLYSSPVMLTEWRQEQWEDNGGMSSDSSRQSWLTWQIYCGNVTLRYYLIIRSLMSQGQTSQTIVGRVEFSDLQSMGLIRFCSKIGRECILSSSGKV